MEARCEQPNFDDSLVIAVMGCTGAGKSSFIKLISDKDSVEIGDGLESMTTTVQRVDFTDSKSGRKVTIVDTPGFDDSQVSDTEILKAITKFLLEEYDANRKLNGLVYVQRISDPRFGGQSKRNLKMFKELCGTDTYKNVVVLTTFWDSIVDKRKGEMRESQLMSNYFRPLVQEGAMFMRHDCSLESAERVLDRIFDLAPVKKVQIVEEMRVEGKSFDQTGAGSVRREEVDLLIAKHKEEIAELQAEIAALRGSSGELRRDLEADKAVIEQKLAKWEEDKTSLMKGVGSAREWLEKLLHKLLQSNKPDDQARIKELEEQLENLNNKSYKQGGVDLARKLPLIPKFIGEPILGTAGFVADVLTSGSRGKK